VEWNYGQADRERVHVQDYKEKAKIEHAALAGDSERELHLVIDVIDDREAAHLRAVAALWEQDRWAQLPSSQTHHRALNRRTI